MAAAAGGASAPSMPELAEQVFAGGLLVLRDLPSVDAFITAARAFTVDHLGAPPTSAHRRASADGLAKLVGEAQRAFTGDPTLRAAFAEVLAAVGLDATRTFWDRLRLRVLPPLTHGADAATVDGAHRPITATRWHRDTWGSGVAAQVNWWLPLWPLTADRTLQFLPADWDRELPNSSGAWDVTRLRDPQARADMPLIPEATAPIDESDPLRPVPDVGEVLVFSGAHVHGTVPNTTQLTRISVETRTVSLDDLDAGRRAPARDSQPPHVAWHWFRRVSDGASLADVAP